MAQATKTTSPVDVEARKNLNVKVGDTVRVYQKIQEKGKTRLQPFEGLVLARKHGKEPGATITVRRISSGVGVERIFPLYSPLIDRIETVRTADVRRSKLYYIREKVARAARRKFKHIHLLSGDEQRESAGTSSNEGVVPGEETLPQEQESAPAESAEASADETSEGTADNETQESGEEAKETKEAETETKN